MILSWREESHFRPCFVNSRWFNSFSTPKYFTTGINNIITELAVKLFAGQTYEEHEFKINVKRIINDVKNGYTFTGQILPHYELSDWELNTIDHYLEKTLMDECSSSACFGAWCYGTDKVYVLEV